ncbi:MAG: BamA/TamA family outer membrane protein, partial [Pacificimonas sp.]
VGSVDIETVQAEPLPGDEIAADIVLGIESAPPRTIAAQLAYDTEDGIRLEGSWQHRNLIRPEGAVTAAAILGNEQQALGLSLRRSNYKKRDRTIGGGIFFTLEDRDAFYRRAVELNAFLERETNLIWQKRWTYQLGPELIFSQERDRSATVGRRAPIEDYVIGAFQGRLGYDGSDDLLNPTTGFRISGLASPEVSLQGGTFAYARTEIEASAYLPFGADDEFVLAGRGLVGSIIGAGRENIAPSRRLYAGGGGSVRGFGFQDLGPRDPDGDPLGGRSVVEGSLEARYRFGDLGAVAFADVGQVYSGSDPGFQDLRVGLGVGARYFTSFGPVRVDIATPLDRRPGESRVALYVSIGQAF